MVGHRLRGDEGAPNTGGDHRAPLRRYRGARLRLHRHRTARGRGAAGRRDPRRPVLAAGAGRSRRPARRPRHGRPHPGRRDGAGDRARSDGASRCPRRRATRADAPGRRGRRAVRDHRSRDPRRGAVGHAPWHARRAVHPRDLGLALVRRGGLCSLSPERRVRGGTARAAGGGRGPARGGVVGGTGNDPDAAGHHRDRERRHRAGGLRRRAPCRRARASRGRQSAVLRVRTRRRRALRLRRRPHRPGAADRDPLGVRAGSVLRALGRGGPGHDARVVARGRGGGDRGSRHGAGRRRVRAPDGGPRGPRRRRVPADALASAALRTGVSAPFQCHGNGF